MLKSFHKEYTYVIYTYCMHKDCYFIIMPFLINSVHSNYFSLSLSIEIPLSLVLWLFTGHLTISSAVFFGYPSTLRTVRKR